MAVGYANRQDVREELNQLSAEERLAVIMDVEEERLDEYLEVRNQYFEMLREQDLVDIHFLRLGLDTLDLFCQYFPEHESCE